ncbi:WD repeat-containing protein 6 [Lamellibrachia satsuma]|nr:WD repeat-containing protein 6 [Lamellibrachia satsuma]
MSLRLLVSSSGLLIQPLGKSIWSLAVNPSETALATGGGDSSVRLWRHLKGSVELNQGCRQQTLHLPHSSTSTQQTVTEEDFPRSVQMLSDHNLLIMTNSGSLWLHQLTIGQSTHLLKDIRFASYSVLAAAPDGHCVLLGSMYGWLKILPMQGQVFSSTVVSNRSYEEQIHRDGKIYAINWLSTNAGTDGYQFLTTGPEGALTMWRLCSDPMTSGHLVVSGQRLYQFLLPYTKQRWVTAALILASNDILVCGDRGGTVHTFCLTGQQQNPQQSFKKIHGKSGVTDIRYHDDHVYSCGRDGQFRKYVTDKNGLHLLSSNKVFKGFDWISRLLFHAGDLLVLGFHTDQFLVYSVGRNQRMLTVSCGGGHRVWDFVLSHGGDGRFVYIKNKDIVVCDASFLANQLILKPSLHGREVTDVKYLFSSTDDGSCFVATASEDTTVNILHVSKCPIRDGQLRYVYHVVASMQAHISNVRALCVSASDHSPDSVSRNILLFSAGGRAQLNVWRIYFQEDNVGCGTKVRDSPSGKESGVSTMEKTVGENASPWVRVAGEMEQVEGGENTVHMDAVSYEGRVVNRTSNNTPCHLLKARTGDSVLAYDSHKTGSSSYHRDALCTPPDIRVDDLRHRHSGDSTALTGGATCWQKHIASHMLLQKERHRKSWKKTACNSSPETRYMDVCAFSLTDLDHSLSPHGHVLTAACSDGYIRIFRFDESDGTFCLIAQSDFHDHCVLVVRHFIITTLANHRRAYILSAGTDGRIAFWDIADIMTECTHSEEKCSSGATNEEVDNFHQGLKQPSMTTGFPASHTLTVENASEIRTNLADMLDSQYNLDSVSPEGTRETGKDLPHDKSDQYDTGDDDMNFEKEFPLELEPVFMLDAHQSGINAVDVRIVKEGSYSRLVVASGGDDNALNVSVIARIETDQDKTPTLELLDTTKIHTAHSAQITGLKILDDNTIVTSSIDQRVAVWSLAMQPKLQLQIQACLCIGISDAVGLDVFTDKNGLHHLAICGVGVQCLEMTTSQC